MGTVRSFPTYYSGISKQALTVSSSVVGLTVPTTVQVRAALITVEHITLASDTVRHWKTGEDPSVTDGQLLYSGDILELTNVETITKVRFIATGSDMKLMIEFFGGGV